MKLDEFKLERYFAKYEFNALHILCASDCETFSLDELLPANKNSRRTELSKLLGLSLGYTESQGNPELRNEISKLFTKTKPQDIVVCTPQEGIFLVMNVLLSPGDKILVQYPCYQSLFEVAKAIGCEVINWKPDKNSSQWRWDMDFLKSNARNAKLIVINSPHNPTGHLFSKKEYTEIMHIAKQNRCYVFSDEMYRLLEHNAKARLPAGSDVYKKCISLSGLSKAFGLPGLRIGWLSIRDKDVMSKVLSFKDYTTICSSALSEHAALLALKNKDRIILRNLNIIKYNMKLLDSFFSRHNTRFSWVRPKAGPVALVKIDFSNLKLHKNYQHNFHKNSHSFNSHEFCDEIIKRAGVMLLPSTVYTVYGYDDFLNDSYFRIGFGRKNMPEALKAFENYLENYVISPTHTTYTNHATHFKTIRK